MRPHLDVGNVVALSSGGRGAAGALARLAVVEHPLQRMLVLLHLGEAGPLVFEQAVRLVHRHCRQLPLHTANSAKRCGIRQISTPCLCSARGTG